MKKILSVIVLAAVVGGFVVSGPSQFTEAIAQQAQPIPSANDDVRTVAGLLLAQELLNIASLTAVPPSGMLKLATAPMQGWEAVGGVGVTAQARAAASSSGLARSEVLLAPANAEFQVTPNIKIKNPLLQRAGSAQNNMLNSIYGAMQAAEGAGQIELAYALASIYLTNGLFNFFNRGVTVGLERISTCLSGQDIKLEISDPSSGRTTEFPVECSKYKALRAVIATEVATGAYSFLGPLVDIGCNELLDLATDAKQLGLKSGAKLAAARAYVQGVQIFPGVFGSCIQPAEGQSEVEALLAAARQAKANNQQELLQEIVGFDYQLYNDADGTPVALYSSFASQRGLAKALEGEPTDQLEALAQDANDPEIGLAAYYELGNRWADKPEAELRQLMTDGATPAVRRAATKALLIQLGRAFDVPCLQSLANGQECK